VAFPPVAIHDHLCEVVARSGRTQFKCAETEKYAHVTFFWNGGVEAPCEREERLLIPSPRVATYDLQPEMFAAEVAAATVKRIQSQDDALLVVNFANADMVGHTGIMEAAERAVEAVDRALARIVPVATAKGGLVAITADHGNAEQMWDAETDQPHTAHTTNPVPLVLCCDELLGLRLRPMGILADVAPTLLQLVGIPPSPGMSGVSLAR
jgi:2,3-bisphosphoglycerate-independent phosphoglycerate mutase